MRNARIRSLLGISAWRFYGQGVIFCRSFGFGVDEESASKLREAQNKVSETLSKDGFCYSRVGMSQSRENLNNIPSGECFKAGPWAVDVEIRRALNNVERDPLAAVHNAGSVLEASFKASLDHHKVEYREDTDTLSNLWQKVVEHIGISQKELDDKDLKKIASALFNIVEGTMHLRNKKTLTDRIAFGPPGRWPGVRSRKRGFPWAQSDKSGPEKAPPEGWGPLLSAGIFTIHRQTTYPSHRDSHFSACSSGYPITN